MTRYSERQYLAAQIGELERLVELSKGSAFMYYSYQQRLEELKEQLAEIPADAEEAKLYLFFWGKPTFGSKGIEAGFLAKAIESFTCMISADYSSNFLGGVNDRGALMQTNDTKLYLTALPRGSFGIELTKLEEDNLFDTAQVKESIKHVSSLIQASAISNEAFLETAESFAGRTIKYLSDFLEVVSKNQAGFGLETGTDMVKIDENDALAASARVAFKGEETVTEELRGINGGLMQFSKRLEFANEATGTNVKLKVPTELLQTELISRIRASEGFQCKVKVLKNTVRFNSGIERSNYTLVDVPELIK